MSRAVIKEAFVAATPDEVCQVNTAYETALGLPQ